MIFTHEQFVSLRDEIYRKLGLYFEDNKLPFIQKRMERRMEVLKIEKPDEYTFFLRYADKEGREMQALANLITTNETYMFREFDQLQAFADYCLPEILKAKETRRDKRLKIWSAGCSSGEEPYTLAIILREIMHDAESWDIDITATDIDEQRIEMANRAVYDDRSVKEVPLEYMAKHFSRTATGGYAVLPATKKLVTVRHLNLSDRSSMRLMRNYDFIFCRNVLIYFDDASRKAVVDQFYGALNKGGYIYLGHSESIGRITNAFTLKRSGKHLVYGKD